MKIPIHPNIACRIVSLGLNTDVVKRLSQMGILPGTKMTIVQVGPLGDPIELAVSSGQNLALRSEEFQSLECEVITLPLSATSPGSATYSVQELQGGLGFQHKMNDRGLLVGVTLRVVEGHPFRIYVLPDGHYVTIGRGEARKVMLEPIEKNANYA